MKSIALVHDWLNNLSGAERVLLELHKTFPDAPIYTLFQNKKFTKQYFPEAEIRTSFLQKVPFITGHHKKLLFLMPTAIESFDLSDFDVVISSSAIFSKGLVLKPKTRHICYCYSPTRQIWDLNAENRKSHPSAGGPSHNFLENLGKHLLRLWDRQASDRVDEFVAISEHVRRRINKYYRRDAKIIYPPVNNLQFKISNFQSISNDPMFKNSEIKTFNENSKLKIKNLGGYYLIVSRLYKHKNIDITVEAFAKLKLPLVIIGTGPELKKLKSQSKKFKNIKFLGFISDEELPAYYQNCRAFIMPQEEDFGITPVEAMSYGKPVLALQKGGATETIIEGRTGEFFDDPIPEALANGIRRLNENYKNYDPEVIKSQARKFSAEKFKEEIKSLVYNK